MSENLRRRIRRLEHWNFGLFLLAVFLGLALVVIVARQAKAETVQDWIHRVHPSCCDHRDCSPVSARRSNGLWIVNWRGVEVPFLGRTQNSPAETTACGTPTMIRCLFISGGTS